MITLPILLSVALVAAQDRASADGFPPALPTLPAPPALLTPPVPPPPACPGSGPAPASARAARIHPFLLATPADLERARAAAAAPGPFRDLARRLAEDALRERVEDLPALERAWWEADREKPWSETYPQIFHHTWMVPARWADLARRCAWASALEPGSAGSGSAGSGSAGQADGNAFGEKARRILLALAEYTFEFEHYDVGMNYTVWGIGALEAYDLLLADPSVALSAAERARIDAFFGRFVEAVLANDALWVEREPGGALNNHYAWHKLGMAAYGLFFDRPELVLEALEGPKGAEMLIRHGFVDDGLWVEGSIPYQLAATTPMVLLAEMLECAEFPRRIWRRDAGDGRALEGSYDALLGLLFPDRTLPPVGDAYARRPHLGRHPDWEILFRRFREPRHAWLVRDRIREDHGHRLPDALLRGVPELPDLDPPDPPAHVSRLWPEHGYAALRTREGPEYWSGRGWTLFATWGANPVHAHADRLSIQVFADGHLWLPDPEARTSAEHAFSSRVQGALNRETLCHNTVIVDRASQRAPPRRLELLEWHSLPGAKRLTIGDLEGLLHPGVRQLRTCIVREEHIVDVFQVEADAPRRIEWLIHVDGEPIADDPGGTTEAPGAPADIPAAAPWSYLRDARERAIPPRWGETFLRGEGRFRVDVLVEVDGGDRGDRGGGEARLLSCGFPLDDGPDPATIPMRAIGVTARSVRFFAVYRSGASADGSLAASVEPGPLGSLEVALRLGERTFRHRVPALEAFPPP